MCESELKSNGGQEYLVCYYNHERRDWDRAIEQAMRILDERRNGYELDSFKDPFQRYISHNSPDIAVTTVTTRQANNINSLDTDKNMTDNNDVTDKKQDNLLKLNDCHNVTDENPILEGKEENRDIEKCFDCKACDTINGICYAKYHFDGQPDSGVRCVDAIKRCDRSF